MPLARALLLALLATAATWSVCGQSTGRPIPLHASGQDQRATAVAAPRSLAQHSTACALAGGWCPAMQQGPLLPAQKYALVGWASSNREARSNGSQHERAVPAQLSTLQLNLLVQQQGQQQPQQGQGQQQQEQSQTQPQQHKPLLPLSGWDIAGITAAGLALLLAASGGIGGGAILVPLNLMVLGFSTSGAVALSNITIVGGTLANLAFNIGRVHPLRNGPLIDWDLIMVMEPSTILGALVGGYLNKLLPGWLTTTTLSALLSYITYKMASKAADIRRKERRAIQATLSRLEAGLFAADSSRSSSSTSTAGDPLRAPLLQATADAEGEAEAAPQPEEPQAPLPLQQQQQLYVAAVGDGVRNDTPSPVATVGLDSAAAAAASDGSGLTGGEQATAVAVNGHASSTPLPIDTGSSRGDGVLPLLTPVDEQQGTRLEADAPATVAEPHQQDSPAPSGRPGAGPWQHPALKGNKNAPSNGSAGAAAAGAAAAAAADAGGPRKPAPTWQLHVPWGKVAVLLALLAGVVASDVLKLQVACPSLAYWLRATAMVPITVATLFAVRQYLLAKGAAQRASGHEPLEGDVEWTSCTTLLYPALCSFAGLAAGIFGVGGGIIKGPLMLEMGVLPEVAAATSATMILFTSMSASVVFISFGAVQADYAALLLALGFGATVAGQLLVMWVNRHIQSRSLLVIIMAAVLGLSSVALAVQGSLATLAAARSHTLWQFHNICGGVA